MAYIGNTQGVFLMRERTHTHVWSNLMNQRNRLGQSLEATQWLARSFM